MAQHVCGDVEGSQGRDRAVTYLHAGEGGGGQGDGGAYSQ
jgi:hypothetical protein